MSMHYPSRNPYNKYLLHNITFMLVYCTNEAVRMCAYIYIVVLTFQKNILSETQL